MLPTEILLTQVVRAAFWAALWAASLQGCRTTSNQISPAELWSLETSDALHEACRFDYFGASRKEIADSVDALATCIDDRPISTLWHQLIENRIQQNWPNDFAQGGTKNVACLESLTNGLIVGYSEAMTAFCRSSDNISMARKKISDAVFEMQSPDCADLVRMTAEGCFIRETCPSGGSGQHSKKRIATTVCHEGVQRIHKVKDPNNSNLAWNDPFVLELTGNRSSARITYGIPNCHGTAQAAAGNLLSDLKLEAVGFARTADEALCGKSAADFLADNREKPLTAIDLQPGGVLINMNHKDCTATDCGTVKLWIDTCNIGKPGFTRPFDAGVFIDGMCVDCWGKILESRGLKSDPNGEIRPGCILTTYDHSVFMVERSAGWCFTYEATSPYGPPQLRANPCLALEQKFGHHYCKSN